MLFGILNMTNQTNNPVVLIYILWILCVNYACVTDRDVSEVPHISLTGLSKNAMKQSALNEDSLWLFLKFEDGDGDISYPATDTTRDVTIIDRRTGFLHDRYKLPDFQISGEKQIDGELKILIFTTCCLIEGIPPCFSDTRFPTDTVDFDVFIRDRAGHVSNTVTIPDILIKCD